MKIKDKYIMENKVKKPENSDKKPNENIGFYLSKHIKIYDPITKKVLLQKRGDN